jgi:uncharacterized DUF497 family protein
VHIAGFDWDAGNRSKCREHGVSAAALDSFFRGAIAVLPDPMHSKSEERFKAIGRTDGDRWMFVVFTLCKHRASTLIRPISARYMHGKEIEHYEKEAAALAKR